MRSPAPELQDAYDAVRRETERLAEPLSPEDQCIQSMPDTSPTKWHRAHTTWFFETFVLGARCQRYEPFDPAFAYLFNSYYEQAGPRHPRAARGVISRPSTEEVGRYRDHVDAAMGHHLAQARPDEERALVVLGLHHEQQHQELLLMDIKHVLSCNPTFPAYRDDLGRTCGVERPLGWLAHDGGVVSTGHAGHGFCFDNELPRHDVVLRPFELADRPVTCGEYAAFVDEGGYRDPLLWLSDGWDAVNQHGWTGPLYWYGGRGDRSVFTLGGVRDLHPAEPVCHLSYYEADAFARWAGARLPLEAEWETVAALRFGPVNDLPIRSRPAAPLHPAPVHAPGDIGFGQVWEWTASPYVAYPGFSPASGAVGEYNGKFMVNQLVLRGGSCLSPLGHVRASYRNFFPPATRWHCSGLRLARDLP